MSTFIVFQDTQTSPTLASSNPTSLSDVSDGSTQPNTTSPATSVEKENINPVTGEVTRAGGTKGKKRKTGVLAAKSSVSLGDKVKESKERKPVAKKRKAAPSAKPKAKSSSNKATGNKANHALGTSRKGNKSNSSSSLLADATLSKNEDVEKDGASQREAERLTQAEIDSKVYDLTVIPLADVTKAFDQGSPVRAKQRLRALKASSIEPELRDHLPPSLGDPELPVKVRPPMIALATPPKETKTFSTPERKQIYAAFTFTSPSPTSERIFKARALGEAPTRIKTASS